MRRIALGLALSVAIACAGGFMALRAAQGPQQTTGIDFKQVVHYVTPQMEIETAAMARRREPAFSGVTDHGAVFHFAPGNAARPQFILFIKNACPCSINAQPLFNRLAEKFGRYVDFVGVIDGNSQDAKNYGSQFSVAFPVVADPHLRVIHGYKAQGGVYSVLVARNGHIIKMWPGYSASLLGQMNRLLAESAGLKVTPFDPQYAPVVKTTGCAFSWS